MNWAQCFQYYWGCFVVGALGLFLVPETAVLAVGHPEWTLSEWVWHHEGWAPNQPIWHWTAAHYLMGALVCVLAVWLVCVAVWLVGHLVFGIWQ